MRFFGFTLLLISILFAGCQRNVMCSIPQPYFYFPNSTYIADTAMDVYVYHTDGKFTQPADSFLSVYMRDSDYVIHLGTTLFKPSYSLSRLESDPYKFDWKVVLRPSAKTYNITLRHDDRSAKNSANDAEFYCTDNVFYSVNGVQGLSQGLTGYAQGGGDIPLAN